MDKVISWTTLISNLCVIAGIVFLGFELRQNSEVAAATIRQEIAHTDLTVALSVATNPEVADYLARANNGEPLSPRQETQLRSLTYATHRRMENVYHQYQAGMLSEEQWAGYLRNLSLVHNRPAMRNHYRANSYSESFQKLLLDIEE